MFVLTLPFQLCLGVPNGLFHVFQPKLFMLFSSHLYVLQANPSHPPWFVDPNIFLSILCSDTLNLCFSLNVRGQLSHSYKTVGEIAVLYILVGMFLGTRGKTKDLELINAKHFQNLIWSSFLLECSFCCCHSQESVHHTSWKMYYLCIYIII